MITNQLELDRCLDRSHIINVEISEIGPLPPDNQD